MSEVNASGLSCSIATFNPVGKKPKSNSGGRVSAVAALMAASVSYAALGVLACTTAAHAQAAGTQQSRAGSQLPAIEITSPEAKRRAASAPTQRADRGAQRRRSQAARRPEAQPAPKAFAVSQDA